LPASGSPARNSLLRRKNIPHRVERPGNTPARKYLPQLNHTRSGKAETPRQKQRHVRAGDVCMHHVGRQRAQEPCNLRGKEHECNHIAPRPVLSTKDRSIDIGARHVKSWWHRHCGGGDARRPYQRGRVVAEYVDEFRVAQRCRAGRRWG